MKSKEICGNGKRRQIGEKDKASVLTRQWVIKIKKSGRVILAITQDQLKISKNNRFKKITSMGSKNKLVFFFLATLLILWHARYGYCLLMHSPSLFFTNLLSFAI